MRVRRTWTIRRGRFFLEKTIFPIKTAAKVSVVARSANFLTGFTIIWIGCLRMLYACGGLRGGRDSIILERLGVALAEHQDDFSGFTCIGYRRISE